MRAANCPRSCAGSFPRLRSACSRRSTSSKSPMRATAERRQLPAITQRLQQTLDKLQKPDASNGRFIKADTWWEGLQRSYAGRGVEFSREGLGESVMLPKELFDSAGDNLLQNALRKPRLDESVGVRAIFPFNDTIKFSVSATGAPRPPQVSRWL